MATKQITDLEWKQLMDRLTVLEAQVRRGVRLSDKRSTGAKFYISEPATQIDGNVVIDGSLDVGKGIDLDVHGVANEQDINWDWGSGSAINIKAYVPAATVWQELDIQSQNLRTGEDARIYIRAYTPDPHAAIVELRAGSALGDAVWLHVGVVTPFKLSTSELALTVPLSLSSGKDIYPDSDGRGIANRFIAPIGLANVTDHFRSGSIPSGYAWQGAPFGTPANITWNYQGDYGLIYHSGANRGYLAKAGGGIGSGHIQYARIVSATLGNAGLRVDDGGDNNYYEWRMVHVSGASVVLRLRERVGGGGVTTTDVTTYPAAGTFVIALYPLDLGGGNHAPYCYLINEAGQFFSISAGSSVSWVPGRVGLVMDDTGQAIFDWFAIP